MDSILDNIKVGINRVGKKLLEPIGILAIVLPMQEDDFITHSLIHQLNRLFGVHTGRYKIMDIPVVLIV